MSEATRDRNNVILPAEALTPMLMREYALPEPLECTLIRRGFNDHYRVAVGDRRFVLRVYLAGKYYIESEGDFRFELDLLAFLAGRGVSVSHAIPLRSGELLGALETEGGVRYFALFTQAEGEMVKAATTEQATALGETVGAFHVAANDFRSPHRRYRLDLEYLMERPLREIEALLARCGRGDLAPYRPALDRLHRTVREAPLTGDAFGIIHGDLHRGNVHFDADCRPTLFDFDHGGFGYRAYDLAVCRSRLSDAAWEAFLASYQCLRPVGHEELALLPAFAAIRPIWDIGDILAMRPAWGDVPTEGEDSDARRVEEAVRILSGLPNAD